QQCESWDSMRTAIRCLSLKRFRTMQKLAELFLLSALSFPALSINPLGAKHEDTKRVTIKQFEQFLTENSGISAQPKSDHDLASLLATMELGERLSAQRLDHWQATMPGEKANRNLP